MKKILVMYFLVVILVFICVPCLAKEESMHQVGRYVAIGEGSSPLIKQLLVNEKKKYRMSSKSNRLNAVLLDGSAITSETIKKNRMVEKAIKDAIPIVIDKPTQGHSYAIMGMDISADAMVIVPRRKGEEFDIHLIDAPKPSSGYHACWIGAGPGPGGYWGNGPINKVVDIIDNEIIRNDNEIGEFGNDAIGCHRRWTVKRADPYIWGDQGQMIDIGFQYDLYYVTSPLPVRKYLTVRTVGKGTSPGKLRADNLFHRGYYQNAVMVQVANKGIEWKGVPLKLEDLAPRTDNLTGQLQVTTGKQFLFGLAVGGMNNETGVNLGFSAYYQKTDMMEFRDYTVSQDGNPDAAQWTYWLSAADGAHLRRKKQAGDLITSSKVLPMIRELPELAKGSFLKPYFEVVYFADGDETGKQEFYTTVEQQLQDLRNGIAIKLVRNKKGVLVQKVTIDFSQVDAQCNGQ